MARLRVPTGICLSVPLVRKQTRRSSQAALALSDRQQSMTTSGTDEYYSEYADTDLAVHFLEDLGLVRVQRSLSGGRRAGNVTERITLVEE